MTPEQLESELRTLEGFERWLEIQETRLIVGSARNGCDCPLFNFLVQRLSDRIEVGSNWIAVADGRIKHSRLSYEFIRQIDDGRRNGEPVTVADARVALFRARKAIGGAA